MSDEEDAGDPTVVDDEIVKLVRLHPESERLRVGEDEEGEGHDELENEGVIDAHPLLGHVHVIPGNVRQKPASALTSGLPSAAEAAMRLLSGDLTFLGKSAMNFRFAVSYHPNTSLSLSLSLSLHAYLCVCVFVCVEVCVC